MLSLTKFKYITIAILAGIITISAAAKTNATTTNTTQFTATTPATQSFSAPQDYSHTWWMNLGLGAGGVSGGDYSDNSSGPAGELSFNYAVKDHQLLTLRTASVSQAMIGGSAYDFGALYGVMNKTDQFLASISAGLAYTKVSDNYLFSSSLNTSKTTVGLPLETQLFWTPTKYFGVGIIGFGNINNTKSFGGALLAIQVGKLK